MTDSIGKCLREPGEYALERMTWFWRENIIDPRRGDTRPEAVRSRLAIDRMIRGPLGLGWSSAQDGGKTVGEYRGNGDFRWCGAGWATAWGMVGLRADVRRSHCASTRRLFLWSEGNARRIALADVRAGDAVIVGRTPDGFGKHITMAAGRFERDWCPTVEANAVGLGPDGLRREGVVKTQRAAVEFVFACRPLPEDLDPKETR